MRKSTASRIDDLGSPPPESGVRRCDAPGCREEGLHRAPKSRDALGDYFWFCLEHVREYNKSWNYYADMSEPEIEREIRRSTTWDRPTWPFGTRDGRASRSQAYHRFNDRFGVFDEDDEGTAENREKRGPAGNTAEAKAFRTLGLEPPVTLDGLKRRYKELVKIHHPDANGGSKDAEERLKRINEAYAILRRFLT